MPHIVRKNLNILIGVLLFASIAVSLSMPFFAHAQAAAAGAPTDLAQPSSCDGVEGYFHVICYTGPIAGALGGALVSMASWVLIIAGMLFDLLVQNTIINFGGILYSANIKTAVETAWTAFRDISNIVIIGMFVFVAISTILGNVEFGAKKMVAKIIIIAVLINFSLLFTKIIIDFSNFSAMQFYNAAALQDGGPAVAAAAAPTATTQKGIAGAFLNYMGVSSYGQSSTAVRKVAEANNSFWVAILHGVVASIFLLGAAIVLLYGSFLLASRALLLIFLLLTSSIAFATYLIPIKVVNTNFGWSQWWSSLLKSAVFAPLLMIFLWVSLSVAAALKVQTGTLGDLLTNPTNGADMSALFSYVIVLGLLFISFKIAASFSTSIGGFNYAAIIPAGIAGVGARAAGMAGRFTVGATAAGIGNQLQKQARNPNLSIENRARLDTLAKPFHAVAKQDFNPGRTMLGSAIAKTVGLKKPDAIAGPKVGGFEGFLKAKDKSNAEKAIRMTPTDDALLKLMEERKRKEAALKEASTATPKPAENAPPMSKPIPTPGQENEPDDQKTGQKTDQKTDQRTDLKTNPKVDLKDDSKLDLKPDLRPGEKVDQKPEQKTDEASVREEALKEYLSTRPKEKEAHDKAKNESRAGKEEEASLNHANSEAAAKLSQNIKGLKEQQRTLSSNASDKDAKAHNEEITEEIEKSNVEYSRALKERNEKIKNATGKTEKADEELLRIEKRATSAMDERAKDQEARSKRREASDKRFEKQQAQQQKEDLAEMRRTHGTAAIASRLADKSYTSKFLRPLGMSGRLSSGALKELKESDKRAKAKMQAEESLKLAPKQEPAPAPAPEGDKH